MNDHQRNEHEHEPADNTDDLGFDLPAPAIVSRTRAVVIGGVALVVLAGAFAFGYLPRRQARAELERDSRATSSLSVTVEAIAPKVTSSDHAIVLPGSVQPLEDTVIYPRANGYIHRWLVDIGDKVKEGDTLAEIDTPELDQELDQARAQLAQAQAAVLQSKANRDFSKTNLDRYKALTPSGVVSQQELDQHEAQSTVDQANVSVSQANVAAQEANIRRLTQLKSFAHVTAPFAGRITARMIDRGALVAPGNATPLFRLVATDPMRVFVQVPQDVAPSVKEGVLAAVSVREFPGKPFEGNVARSAGALDAMSRTMNTEVRVPNPDGAILSGMYAQVSFTLSSPHRVFELPGTALINDAKGVRVALIDSESRIHLQPVTIERDLGSSIQVSSGLSATDRVVKVAGSELAEGQTVSVAPPPASSASGASATSGPHS